MIEQLGGQIAQARHLHEVLRGKRMQLRDAEEAVRDAELAAACAEERINALLAKMIGHSR